MRQSLPLSWASSLLSKTIWQEKGCGEKTFLTGNTTINQTHHVVRDLGDAHDEEPHPYSEYLWVNSTPRPANSGASRALSRVNLQEIERPKQVLWSAHLGEEVALNEHVPQMDDDRHASPKELAKAAVLHLGCPNNLGRLVLDITGGMKKLNLIINNALIVVFVFMFFFFIVIFVAVVVVF